jgi:hypothetical protein
LQANGLVPAGLNASVTYSLVLAAVCVAGSFGFARRMTGGALLRGAG